MVKVTALHGGTGTNKRSIKNFGSIPNSRGDLPVLTNLLVSQPPTKNGYNPVSPTRKSKAVIQYAYTTIDDIGMCGQHSTIGNIT